MGIGPCFNIEIQCDEEYAKDWISRVKDELKASGIIVTPGEMEGIITFNTKGGPLPERCQGQILIEEVVFNYCWACDSDEYYGNEKEGIIITRQIYYSEEMSNLLPELNIMSKLFDVIRVKTKKPTEFYSTAYTI
ncbi:hypothetical protein LCGC14_0317990 [marine sediment metagenome]|uniref:Uncharacterized protein n=1 Tax=marine sediment metagenome TaxID=412755 RepID=A0A0F9TJY4_9ZZZZ